MNISHPSIINLDKLRCVISIQNLLYFGTEVVINKQCDDHANIGLRIRVYPDLLYYSMRHIHQKTLYFGGVVN